MPKIGYRVTEETKQKISRGMIGVNTWMKGKKHSEETKKKMSEARKGLPAQNKGVKHSETTKEKMRISHLGKNTWSKGRKLTEEHIQKIKDGNKGNKRTDETKEKLRNRMLGTKVSEETKQKLREANLGKKHSPETRRRESESHKGDKCHFWRGGITKTNASLRSGIEYKLWRESVFERDDYQCIWCGARSSKGNPVVLNADHIKPFAYFPELRFSIDNGRTLCKPCHMTTETYLRKSTR